MVEARHLTKRYGHKAALSDVSFSIPSAGVTALLGLNGAGKSTTMNILTGYIGPTEGTALINGTDVLAEPMKVRSMVGYLPEQPPLYQDMTVEEYLRFVADLNHSGRNRKALTERAIEMSGIADVRRRLIRNLSKGYKQRVGIAQAILPKPKVLILDEPTVALDPTQVVEMRSLIRTLASEASVLVSSHILAEVQEVCDRVLVLNEGRLIADDTPEHLSSIMHGREKIALRVLGDGESVKKALLSIPGIIRAEAAGSKEAGTVDFIAEGAAGRDIREDAFRALSAADLPILRTYGSELTLEEVFLRLIEKDRGEKTV